MAISGCAATLLPKESSRGPDTLRYAMMPSIKYTQAIKNGNRSACRYDTNTTLATGK
ncbi:hypothetical protein HDG35_005328 [Paraburkholderia sp. JPY681]|nr:hypothetical protein [Paraburkholderia atlantica]